MMEPVQRSIRHGVRGGILRMVCIVATLAGAAQAASPVRAPSAAGEVVLRGHLLGERDAHRYHQVPFQVPVGTARITVEFDYTGREEKATIDLGLLDPGGFRGWSGGNKRSFTVSAADATPSYLPGALPAGQWKLLLGVPNLRAGHGSDYVARIRFTSSATPDNLPDALEPILTDAPGWYRGDLHMHTAHSDASCPSQSGRRVPCPMFVTLQAAVASGLDFVAVTDHNTVSHLQPLREMQPYFDRLLLLTGMEVTTFQGHANVFGLQAPLDFRLGEQVPDWKSLTDETSRRGLLLSINHPIRPSDERCMGCGWTPQGEVDWAGIGAVEVVNGGDADTPFSGIPFWHRQLDAGHRLTAVGGSDNHDASRRAPATLEGGTSPIGRPTTVVHARALSRAGILDGLRAGRVFVDVQGRGGSLLDLNARYGGALVGMGADLAAGPGAAVRFEASVDGVPDGARVVWIVDGQATEAVTGHAGEANGRSLDWRSDGRRHWVRVEVRAADGALLLLGNPVYVNFPARGTPPDPQAGTGSGVAPGRAACRVAG